MRALTFLARRFVAGDAIEDAIEAVLALNRQGLKATLDYLGEDSLTRTQAVAAAAEYRLMLRKIAEAAADCNVSLKLSQFGLALDPDLARENLELVLKEAAKFDNFVRIDMEGSAYTQATLDLFYAVFANYSNVGVVIQAALRRSQKDIEALVRNKVRVRLCKGAYKEPPPIAFQAKEEVNANYDKLAAMLVKAPLPAFATHDDARIAAACIEAEKADLKKGEYELQMLYGLRARRWRELKAQGHAVRVYVPYGTHWFPYFYRRLRERKENALFVLKNLFE